jgi:4-amino-4-deoxy-L-arabinose transferase-like glycosyltransferase
MLNGVRVITVFSLMLIILLPRVFSLDAFQTADEKRWVANTAGFITNLAHRDWSHLMLQPHPGITTQWLASPTVSSPSWTIRKMPLVISQSLLILALGYLFWRLSGPRLAALVVLLLALDPLLISHTRIYAMDSLLSLFLLLSLSSLLLWLKTKSQRYLVFAALTAAAAVLSKLSGLLIIPLSLLAIIYHLYSSRTSRSQRFFSAFTFTCSVWLLFFLMGLILILPSLALAPHLVINDMLAWFKSDDYQLHRLSPTYYLGTLFFLATPLHFMAIPLLPLLFVAKRLHPPHRKTIILLLSFSLLFLVMMSLGAKKGDRYLLPVFLMLDVVTAYVIHWLLSQNLRLWSVRIVFFSIIGLLLLQAHHLYVLHPHYLSYVNPITDSFFGERRLGWGEGLDLAATYLNQLPDAANMTVASYYPIEFQSNFAGHAVPVHQHDSPSVDYVIIYRAMFERGQSAWETDVVNLYRPQTPLKVVTIGTVPMAWIYRK